MGVVDLKAKMSTEEKYVDSTLLHDSSNGYGSHEAPTVFKDEPVQHRCQHCHTEMITELDYKVGKCSWITFGVCCVLPVCWLGCCLLPFCLTNVKDVKHKCSNCHETVGEYNR